MRPICVKCGYALTCLENDVVAIHFIGDQQKLGIDFVVLGDRWGCLKCKCPEILTGFGEIQMAGDISAEDKKRYLLGEYIEIKRI